MSEKSILKLKVRELKKLKIIQQTLDKQITQEMAASILRLSVRQIKRLVRKVITSGEQGIIHQARGQESNRKISEDIKHHTLALYQEKYHDFGATFACEKLAEIDGIEISKETLRKWLLEGGLSNRERKRKANRQWRQRKECFGQMVQMDGSNHDWLEGRGPKLVIMGYIDDATNTVFARFYDYEGTIPAMDSFKRYINKFGMPQSVYLDKHRTYKSPRELTPEEEWEGMDAPLSQFERALDELGVTVIHAHSPQAKGRVERLFGTLQDRLIKEMRLLGIKTKEEANRFLDKYLPVFNRKFGVEPISTANVHMPKPKNIDINRILCIKTVRTVKKDNTVTLDGKLYLIEDKITTNKVTFEQSINGSLCIMNNDQNLKHKVIMNRPSKQLQRKPLKRRSANTPSPDHPWRKAINPKGMPKKKIVRG
jgi:hypothetical protein